MHAYIYTALATLLLYCSVLENALECMNHSFTFLTNTKIQILLPVFLLVNAILFKKYVVCSCVKSFFDLLCQYVVNYKPFNIVLLCI